MDNVAII